MGLRHLRGDVTLLREAVSLVREFGLHSAERLAHVAAFLERSVYAPRSLHALPGGVGFTLLNPPLRVGAFSSIRVLWDGQRVPPDQLFIRGEGQAIERPVTDITNSRPVELRPGQRIAFRLAGVPAGPGPHRVRLELQSIAIPPLVWFEFSDPIAEAPPT
ncbi:MAG: hypothetical protein L3K14_02590 [Thermoplasmata archaeon]|nr:hypothetical protein [Thermoplasmata archaeon]